MPLQYNMKIALVSYHKQEKLTQGLTNDEDAELIGFLKSKGLHIVSVIWNDENVDWSRFDIAIIKSTWDYHHDISSFLSWIESIDHLGVRVFNPVEVIKWNSHKKYLEDIAKAGLPVIPAVYIKKGDAFDSRCFEHFGTDKLVLKPCISAGAENTIIIDKTNLDERSEHITKLLKEQDYMVQPFVEEIGKGEWSFLFFNGVYSHCALKTPGRGDFRVQHHHGGSISYPSPEPLHIKQAASYFKCIPGPTLYARVDGIIRNGSFELMELELIEPYLYFNGNNALMENYWRALEALIS